MSHCTPMAFPEPRCRTQGTCAAHERFLSGRGQPVSPQARCPAASHEMGPGPRFLKGVMVGISLAVPIWVLVIALLLG